MFNLVKKHAIKTGVLLAALMGPTYAFAACPAGTSLLPLASDIANGTQNTTICVDIPNKLTSNHIVFDIDTPVTQDGIPVTDGGVPLAFKHMWLMSSANLAFMKKNLGGLDPLVANPDPNGPAIPRFSVIGIIHGSAIDWALSDAWWKAQVDDDGNQLYPNGNPNDPWFAKLEALQQAGVDVHLEVCAVTLEGDGLTRADVYSDPATGWRILVNQGAFGRMSTLHRYGYAIILEGYEHKVFQMDHY